MLVGNNLKSCPNTSSKKTTTLVGIVQFPDFAHFESIQHTVHHHKLKLRCPSNSQSILISNARHACYYYVMLVWYVFLRLLKEALKTFRLAS